MNALETLPVADDEISLRCARGISAVERAVRAHARREPAEHALVFVVPADVAPLVGWTLCSRCGRPCSPSWAVRRGGEVFHPTCIAIVLEAA